MKVDVAKLEKSLEVATKKREAAKGTLAETRKARKIEKRRARKLSRLKHAMTMAAKRSEKKAAASADSE